ncbi:ectoine hydroxylase-related dioxygenase (phytanoyl-CoA dioxygenase family) [Litoreibacter halocynthiae]|uniref:Ectoine hydroxylase-related dioxygenase (Phytanoyl-CoA dioxygenase family) n=1 Tax=Litoreibacter halocynthiae TaxID=1242689 RepID=A0A4V3EWI1_9RHOB|nr:phytanoyl-CoA dioxygenase family protein [Litoreibacter halocynthiae]TDT77015.1 ectoine hydroxylase-related dioxygenase (phytanoyl-CoA dioxygenase family) [Litoreibacter halocynthiae]
MSFETLTQAQKDFYDKEGYLILEKRIPDDIMADLHAEIAKYQEQAKSLTESTDQIDLEDSHTPENPRVRRIKQPHTHNKVMRDLMYSDLILAPARDLIGPDLRLHTTKLNMKSAGFGAAVEWHQDFAFYPHTNDDVLAIAVILDDMDSENGPLMVFPGSHKHKIYDHHVDGVFAGAIDLAACGFDMKDAVELKGPAGSVSIHHGRIVHGSSLNKSTQDRRLLFYEMMAADAFPIMGSLTRWSDIKEYNDRMLCGDPTLEPRVQSIGARIPAPLPTDNFTIYEIQKRLHARSFEVAK